MFGITDLYLFIIAGLLLNITPGADMLYILSNTFQKGFKAGVIATIGICLGCLFHVFLAIVGLSALLQSSEFAFLIVKYIGMIYLIYLGISMILAKNKDINIDKTDVKTISLKKVLLNGILINSLNPKIAIFFITFLPQFVDVNSDNKSMALLVLGLIFILFGGLVNIVLSYIALNISSKVSYSNTITKYIKKSVGTLFVGFGLKLAMEKS